jgi:hypothetical protein
MAALFTPCAPVDPVGVVASAAEPQVRNDFAAPHGQANRPLPRFAHLVYFAVWKK